MVVFGSHIYMNKISYSHYLLVASAVASAHHERGSGRTMLTKP
jgi:hypothetical protein